MSHAFAIVGVFNLTDAKGQVVYQLLQLRNPWRFDGYSGPWNDNDAIWTSGVGVDYRTQVNYVKNSQDGLFFIDINTFQASFLYFCISYYHDDWPVSYFERLNDDGSLQRYTFSTTIEA